MNKNDFYFDFEKLKDIISIYVENELEFNSNLLKYNIIEIFGNLLKKISDNMQKLSYLEKIELKEDIELEIYKYSDNFLKIDDYYNILENENSEYCNKYSEYISMCFKFFLNRLNIILNIQILTIEITNSNQLIKMIFDYE